MKRKLAILVCVVLVFGIFSTGSTEAARPDKSWKNWFGHFSGGWVVAQGDAGDFVDDTWTLSGGATWWPGNVGLDIELGWTDFDVSDDAIRRLNEDIGADPDNRIDDGTIAVWSLTTDVIWGPETDGKVSFYLAGGIGAYYIDGQLTTRGLVYYPPVCHPWTWPWCWGGGVGTGNIIVGSESTTEFGYNGGVGLNIELASGSQVYFEVKYHYIDATEAVRYIPIQLGYRW